MNERDKKIIDFYSKLTLEERKKSNITREHLDVLLKVYYEDTDLISQMINEEGKLELSNFNMVGQNLRGINFSNIVLRNCNFKNSKFDNVSFKSVISKVSNDTVNLEGIDLSDNDLSSSLVFERALGEVVHMSYSFQGLKLDKATFVNSDLTNANFDDASLKHVNFSFANLTGASFINSDVEGTNFKDSIFFPAQLALSLNFDQAIFSEDSVVSEIVEYNEEIINPQFALFKYIRQSLKKLKFNLKSKLMLLLHKRKAKKLSSDTETSINKVSTHNQVVNNITIDQEKKFVKKVEEKSNENRKNLSK